MAMPKRTARQIIDQAITDGYQTIPDDDIAMLTKKEAIDTALAELRELMPKKKGWSINTPQPDRTMNYAYDLCVDEVMEVLK